MKKTSSFIFASVIAWGILFPTLLFAQEKVTANDITTGLKSGAGIIDTLNDTIVKSLAALLMSSALLVFFAGIVQYIWGRRQGDSGKVKTGNEFMTWGLVALFVMFSVYGIIRLAQSVLFGSKDVSTINIPTFNFKRGTSGDVINNSNLSPGNGGTGGGTLSPVNGGTGGTTLPGYGGSTSGCTPPMIQSPEGGCYTPLPSATTNSNSSGSNSIGARTVQSCIEDGGTPEVCRCEITSGGIWSLSDNSCSTDSAGTQQKNSTVSEPSSNTTQSSAFTECLKSNDRATCDCEITNGGTMGTDGECSN